MDTNLNPCGSWQCDLCASGEGGLCWDKDADFDDDFYDDEEWYWDAEDCPGGCGFSGTPAELRNHACAILAELKER